MTFKETLRAGAISSAGAFFANAAQWQQNDSCSNQAISPTITQKPHCW
jgi:hypothetical protein